MGASPGAVARALPALIICSVVAFGGILYGYTTGEISGIIAMDYFRKQFSTGYISPDDGLPDITSQQSSEIVSLLSAGTFLGCLIAAPIADRAGRRISLLVSCVIFAVGVVLQTVASAIPMFVASRFFCGLGLGIVTTVVPMYLSEAAPRKIRGSMISSYQLIQTVGLLLSAIVVNATKNRDDSSAYRIPIAIQFAWVFILACGMVYLPESPHFRVKQDRHDAAAKALSKLRRLPEEDKILQEELAQIHNNQKVESSIGSVSYRELCRGTLGFRLLTGALLMALSQLTGINFIFYFGTTFFSSSGIANSYIIQVIMNVVNVVSTLPGLWMVEKWGRRPVLLFGAIGMAISQLLVAIVGTATGDGSSAGNKCLIAFSCVFIFFFACSWGPVGWVVCAEIFPLSARAKGVSITTSMNWLFNWALAYATPYMVDSGAGNADMGSKVFFIWGGFCCASIAFVYFMIYETKGLSLDQIDELYATADHAWTSGGFLSVDGGVVARPGNGGSRDGDEGEKKEREGEGGGIIVDKNDVVEV
ncbi:MAG: High-affinity glucose transporter rgt2 [Cirrosporium novae-zelandiae]|nr:MAG: High-affinity glucose transporter rgt2 [Cirrosporium novae-zelandiae]